MGREQGCAHEIDVNDLPPELWVEVDEVDFRMDDGRVVDEDVDATIIKIICFPASDPKLVRCFMNNVPSC